MTGKQHSSNKNIVPGAADVPGQKKVKQGNHEIYTIPPCMEEWADEPLYLVVARWGLQQKRWINRNDITATFNIPERRASFQLSYISSNKLRVACRTRYVKTKSSRRHRVEIFVDYVFSSQKEESVHEPPCRRNALANPVTRTSRGVGSGMTGNTGLWEQLLKGCREEHEHE
ncbi:CaiF/GrlA family transcriptional regulator [Salmonella enterica subsp. enterica]|nr:CaiF/GrlA family transcriptional regulator [Salmonella enterica subsp. enterica serovar Sandiego]